MIVTDFVYDLQKKPFISCSCPTKPGELVQLKMSELVQLKLNIETLVGESTPTKAGYGVPLPLVEVGVSQDQQSHSVTLVLTPCDSGAHFLRCGT